jgi:hypothetical protein
LFGFWLSKTNQINQINQTNQMNQTNQWFEQLAGEKGCCNHG